ncbi:MAG: glycosyltransferase [Terriglobales bacterium]
MIPTCIGAVSLLTWIYLILARGGFWRMRPGPELSGGQASPARRIAIIVPARDEAAAVAQAVRSLVRQAYPGPIHIFLVDDHSSDGTAEIARQAAREAGNSDRLSVVEAQPLPRGWTGKLWALSQGLQAAAHFDAEYYLLTDADVVHEPENLRSLVLRAEGGDFDLVSLMVKLHCESLAERVLIPAFVFFFFKLYPPAWVARPDRRTAAAAGGCMLVRRAALERIGGIAVIRDHLIDDCALARAVKSGGRVWLGPTASAWSLRRYQSWTEIGRMIARTAFTQLRHSTLLLFMAVAGMAITYLAPPALLLCGPLAATLGAAAWLLQSIAYWPTLRFYGLSPLWAPLLPLASLFYLGTTILSAVQYWRGYGGLWKGRVQDPSSPKVRSG